MIEEFGEEIHDEGSSFKAISTLSLSFSHNNSTH